MSIFTKVHHICYCYSYSEAKFKSNHPETGRHNRKIRHLPSRKFQQIRFQDLFPFDHLDWDTQQIDTPDDRCSFHAFQMLLRRQIHKMPRPIWSIPPEPDSYIYEVVDIDQLLEVNSRCLFNRWLCLCLLQLAIGYIAIHTLIPDLCHIFIAALWKHRIWFHSSSKVKTPQSTSPKSRQPLT